jgi:hypothetical protein
MHQRTSNGQIPSKTISEPCSHVADLSQAPRSMKIRKFPKKMLKSQNISETIFQFFFVGSKNILNFSDFSKYLRIFVRFSCFQEKKISLIKSNHRLEQIDSGQDPVSWVGLLNLYRRKEYMDSVQKYYTDLGKCNILI